MCVLLLLRRATTIKEHCLAHETGAGKQLRHAEVQEILELVDLKTQSARINKLLNPDSSKERERGEGTRKREQNSVAILAI